MFWIFLIGHLNLFRISDFGFPWFGFAGLGLPERTCAGCCRRRGRRRWWRGDGEPELIRRVDQQFPIPLRHAIVLSHGRERVEDRTLPPAFNLDKHQTEWTRTALGRRFGSEREGDLAALLWNVHLPGGNARGQPPGCEFLFGTESVV